MTETNEAWLRYLSLNLRHASRTIDACSPLLGLSNVYKCKFNIDTKNYGVEWKTAIFGIYILNLRVASFKSVVYCCTLYEDSTRSGRTNMARQIGGSLVWGWWLGGWENHGQIPENLADIVESLTAWLPPGKRVVSRCRLFSTLEN